MALSSDRKVSKVDPSNGIYVEMEGIMEVRYNSEDVDYCLENEDFYTFQRREREIPDTFCQKDRYTGMQAFFFCLVCDCDLKSVKSLRDHAKGGKHIKKACEKKRQIFGQPQEPQNAPRVKKIKKEQPRIDVNKTLEERLKESAQPAVGLPYIQEFRNPEDRSSHRMYTCTLQGCKSAWGTSDDIYNHVIKYKHARNFFREMHPDDKRISGLSNADILLKAAELHEEEGGSDDLDYNVIVIIRDYSKWKELRDRPDDWSEKKAKLGMVGRGMNPNMEPLGERKRRNLGAEGSEASGSGTRAGAREGKEVRERSPSPSIFDEEAWKDHKSISPRSACQDFMDKIDVGMDDIKEEVEQFEGNEESSKLETIKSYMSGYRLQIDLHEDFKAPAQIGQERFNRKMKEWKDIIDKAEEELMEKKDQEERHVKHVGALLQEVEDEMENYESSRDTRKYQNIKSRMSNMTRELSQLKPSKDLNKIRKEAFNQRIDDLWKKFENLSDAPSSALSSLLESQMQEKQSAITKEKNSKEIAVADYRKEVTAYVRVGLEKYQFAPNLKIGDGRELDAMTKYITDKILHGEVDQFQNKGLPWIQFKMSDLTRASINSYLKKKMDGYVMGSL